MIKKKELSILFIGNSHTYEYCSHDLPAACFIF